MRFPKFAVVELRCAEEAARLVHAIVTIIRKRSLLQRCMGNKLGSLKLCIVNEDYGPDAGVYYLEGDFNPYNLWDGTLELPEEAENPNYHYFTREKNLLLPIVNRIAECISNINDPLTDDDKQVLQLLVNDAK